MSPSRRVLLKVAATATLGAFVAIACGPFLGVETLRDRKQYLLAPPSISFENELRRLVPAPADKLPVVEFEPDDQNAVSRESLESKELSPELRARVQAMRGETGGNFARVSGEGPDAAILLYTAGAVSFKHAEMGEAKRYFQAAVALPENSRQLREPWARFMLGRIAVGEGNQSEATAEFDALRTEIAGGVPDRLGLAVASFGEQARGAWRAGDVHTAVQLYARQASYGSQSGANSLLVIAGLILRSPDLLDRAVQDAMARKLLFLCLNNNGGSRFFVGPDNDGNDKSAVDRIVETLNRHGLVRVEGAGLLAAAAYSRARYDLAGRLAALEDTPVSAWVSAKLALRAGDREAALKAYGRALAGFGANGSSQLKAEAAVVRVSRSDYTEALELFLRALPAQESNPYGTLGFFDYWGDAAYLAERVLTLRELEDFVNHKLPGVDAAAWSRLRSILARRLLRAGQMRKAVSHFDDAKTRDEALQYVNAIGKANSWWRWKRARAESWFIAATIARTQGMDILGFEKEPDFAMWDGNYEVEPANRPDAYVSEDEQKRVALSKPENDVRFQYRLTAVDHAAKAADLLPRSTQAFAAVLCESTSWVIDRQPNLARQLYARYLHQGAHVSWGRSFGRQCPAPDFAAASNWSLASREAKQLRRHGSAHPIYAGLVVFAALTMATLLVFLGRRWWTNRQSIA